MLLDIFCQSFIIVVYLVVTILLLKVRVTLITSTVGIFHLDWHLKCVLVACGYKIKQVRQQACKTLIPPYVTLPPPILTAPPSLAAKFFPGEICIGRCPNFSFFQVQCAYRLVGETPRPKFTTHQYP